MSKKTKDRKRNVKWRCEICKQSSYTPQGWHLSNDLNFCSDKCVAIYLEKFATKQKELEKRITEVEKRMSVKK